jgi:hypothetical protein
MKSKLFTAAVATVLLASAGLASAAEPVALTDNQMDTVAAGAITSTSAGLATAVLGFGTTASDTSARVTYFSRTTNSTSVALAAGLLPLAVTSASSTIR